uniref:ARAD1C22154p n=1 Tax=Blastobotrys adeninivorans TaxID=409370 RepID=A0A060T7I7_BLAAD
MYYQRAREALSRARFGNYQYAQACMLCALYTHRARAHSSGPTVWHLTGMAMRAAVKVGLHRRQRVCDDQNPYEMEVNKRLFWSIYSLDRLLGHMLGRPFSIPEHDIDVQLPVDVEDSCTDFGYLQKLRMAQEIGEIIPTKVSAMTFLIHEVKLRQIESQIQASLYAVNPSSLQIPRAEGILEARLDEWFKQTPPRSLLDSPGMVGYDHVYLNYCRAKRLLLSPQFNALDSLRLNMSEPVFREYVALNGGICKAYRALHARGTLTYSPVALQTLFISGLALAYCLWLDHQGVGTETIADIEACQTMLGVLAERWAHARNFKGVFDQLVATINEPYSDTQARSAPDPSIFKPLPEDWFFGPLDFTFWDLSASVR